MPYVLEPHTPPDREIYGPEELNLSPRFTRAIFKQYFNGKQAQPWDKSRPIKRWADLSAVDQAAKTPQAPYRYFVWGNVNGVAAKVPIETSMAYAATFNLPGTYDWPKYVLAPTLAYSNILDANGSAIARQSVPPEELATEDDVMVLLQQLDKDRITVFRTYASDPGGVIFPDSETRRFWNVQLEASGPGFSIQRLLIARHKNGYNAPGKWTVLTGSSFIGMPPGKTLLWVSAVPDDSNEFDSRPDDPIPQRDLLATEHIKVGLIGVVQIWRTDRVTPPEDNNDEVLARIDQNVQTILTAIQVASGSRD